MTSKTRNTTRTASRPRRGTVRATRRAELLDQPTEWMADGLCRQADPDAWFPEPNVAASKAKAICATCPVQAECLAYALASDQRFGVWGGLSERERRPLQRSRVEAQPESDADQDRGA